MEREFIILTMIFLHIFDDYYLQGTLANLKQRKWWQEHYPSDLYKYDYIIALITHAFSWTFMVMLPIAFNVKFQVCGWFFVYFVLNLIVHAVVDHIKANLLRINLITDQAIHIVQIIFTWMWLIKF